MATTNAAIAVVVNDILGRLTVTFSAFSALSSRIFCSKIEHVWPEQRIFEIVTWLGEQTWTARYRPSDMSRLSNAAIVVVINDILARLAASFSAFHALSGGIFCLKIERV